MTDDADGKLTSNGRFNDTQGAENRLINISPQVLAPATVPESPQRTLDYRLAQHPQMGSSDRLDRSS